MTHDAKIWHTHCLSHYFPISHSRMAARVILKLCKLMSKDNKTGAEAVVPLPNGKTMRFLDLKSWSFEIATEKIRFLEYKVCKIQFDMDDGAEFSSMTFIMLKR